MMGQSNAQLLMMQTVARAMDGSDNIVLVLHKGCDGLTVLGGNDASRRALGFAANELIGLPFASLAAPDSAASVLAGIEQAAGEAASHHAELQCRRADGSRFWLGLHVMPSADPNTGEFRCVLLGRDITARLQAREQNQAIQNLLAKVLISVDIPVAILAVDGRIIKTNPCFDRLLGQSGQALEGRLFLDLADPADRSGLETALHRQTDDRAEHRGRLRLILADGKPVSVHLTAVLADTGDQQRFRILTIAEEPIQPGLFQVAGKIRLIGLQEVKSALGERWPAMRERAIITAERVLQRKLGPKDSHVRTRDDGFMICFAELDEEAASFTAAVIGREIRSRLIGQGDAPENASVTAIAANISVPASVRLDHKMPFDILEARLNARRGEIEAQARQTLAAAMKSASCTVSPVYGRDGRNIVAEYARLPVALQRSLPIASAALPMAERIGFDVDALTVRLAGQLALDHASNGAIGHMFVDIGFDVFQSRVSIDAFLESCRTLDPVIRQKIVMVLNNLPDGLTSSRMIDCVHRLRPFCRAVGFELREPELPDFGLALASSPVLVIDADRFAPMLSGATRFDKLRGRLQALRARLMVRNVGNRETEDRMLAVGVDFVSPPPPDAVAR